jgi:hypothetical protein
MTYVTQGCENEKALHPAPQAALRKFGTPAWGSYGGYIRLHVRAAFI